MSASSVKVRKDLSADGLISVIREGFDAIPEPEQREDQDISMSDALMSAFAMFSLKDPSLLAFDERRRDPNDNFRSIYGIQHVPCDTQMRTILDPVEPETLYPLFTEIFNRVQRTCITSSASSRATMRFSSRTCEMLMKRASRRR